MNKCRNSSVLVAFALCTGCVEPVAGPSGGSSGAKSTWTVELSPSSPLDQCEPVVEIRLAAADSGASATPERIALVEGTVSAISLRKYENGEVTEVVAERTVPTNIYYESGLVRIRPLGVLALGQTYSLVSGTGYLGSILVAPRGTRPYLSRTWPPRDSQYGVLQALFCGAATPKGSTTVELFPPTSTANLLLGIDAANVLEDSCVRIVPENDGEGSWQPPPAIDGIGLEPTPFAFGELLSELRSIQCETGESPFGPGCMRLIGNTAAIRGPDAVTLWVLVGAMGVHIEVVENKHEFVVPELETLEGGKLKAVVFDLAGRSMSFEADVVLPTPAPRVIVNEVMANPLGPEPEEEWVELANVGTAPAQVIGFKLADGGGQVDVPALVLEPGSFVVLARSDFQGGLAGDVPPPAGASIVRLPVLAKNGISNGGEAISLIDNWGRTTSVFPARTSSREGISLARRSPTVLDSDPLGFVSHAPPGASPGGRNQVE